MNIPKELGKLLRTPNWVQEIPISTRSRGCEKTCYFPAEYPDLVIKETRDKTLHEERLAYKVLKRFVGKLPPMEADLCYPYRYFFLPGALELFHRANQKLEIRRAGVCA